MRPLDRLAAAVGEQHPRGLRPLPSDGWPREVTPLVGALNGLLARVDAALPMLLSFLLALLSILLLGRLRNSIARHGLLLEEANP